MAYLLSAGGEGADLERADAERADLECADLDCADLDCADAQGRASSVGLASVGTGDAVLPVHECLQDGVRCQAGELTDRQLPNAASKEADGGSKS
ncbi:hypothetical protein HLK59_23690 [Streptomyces sp. S3(2020)]|nr:hypothetical protein [Streptomyces sp. S3(2020)]